MSSRERTDHYRDSGEVYRRPVRLPKKGPGGRAGEPKLPGRDQPYSADHEEHPERHRRRDEKGQLRPLRRRETSRAAGAADEEPPAVFSRQAAFCPRYCSCVCCNQRTAFDSFLRLFCRPCSTGLYGQPAFHQFQNACRISGRYPFAVHMPPVTFSG